MLWLKWGYRKCYASNYIVVHYTSDNLDNQFPIALTSGLGFNNNNYDYSDKISSVTLNNQEIFSIRQSLDISVGAKLEIYFSSPLESIDYFFEKDNFNGQNSLIVSIDLSHFDYSILKSINHLFSGCSSLISIDFSNFKASIDGMEGLFEGCSSLQSIDLSGLITSSVTSIQKMFSNCNSLSALYIPGLDLSQVNNADNMLSSQLKYLNIMGATLSDTVKSAIATPSLNGIFIRQDKNRISNTGNNDFKYKEIFCNFNSENGKCESSNYVTIYYPQKNNNNYQFSFSEDYSDKKGLIDLLLMVIQFYQKMIFQ